MAQIDPLIETLFKHGAEALLLEGGQQPTVTKDRARLPAAKPTLTPDLVKMLIAEIAPPAERVAVFAGRATTFSYAAPSGRVRIELGASGAARVLMEPGARTPGDRPAGIAPAAVSIPTPAPVSVSASTLTLDGLLRLLVERGGSDLHLSSEARPRLRIDGSLADVGEIPVLDAATVERLLGEIVPERNREEFRLRGDSDFAHEIPGVARIRCNFFRDRKGPGGVFRVIPAKILTVDDLGLSAELRELCALPRGMVLVTGPTGSGKSTTLAALVDYVNATRTDHIITIEDPIEFVHVNRKCLVNQREVPTHTKDFKTALRAALREDPDVVLVGEMRDLETVAIALETAETGHLVFGTLHTNSAVSTVDRLIDQFPADQQPQVRVMLGESLRCIISQTLCRRIGGGRVAALEVLMVTPAIANLVREGKTFQILSIMQTGRKYGMVTLNDALVDLVRRKLVEPREAWTRAMDKAGLVSALRAQNITVEIPEAAPKAAG